MLLVESLNEYIGKMNGLNTLEQVDADSKKSKNIEEKFEKCIDEIYKVVQSVQKAYKEMDFKISVQRQQELLNILRICDNILREREIDENTVKDLQGKVDSSKAKIINEWNGEYKSISAQKIALLQNVKGLVANQSMLNYAINQIKKGVSWDFKDDVLDAVQNGIKKSNEIIRNLELIDEVTEFLNKVSAGKATIKDLTDSVLSWLEEKNMLDKFTISLK